MDLQLNAKRALVTGSTAGIGFAIASALAAEGAHVVLNGRTQARVNDALVRLKAAQPQANVTGIAADLSTAAGVAQLLAACPEVDVLVNNLGIFAAVPFEAIDDSEWFRFFEVNVMSGVRLARHYLPQMKTRDWGRIIFISSESGVCPPAEMVHYGMTKSAQLSVSRGLAETCVGTRVTVNAVLPGPTRTEGVGGYLEEMARQKNISFAEMEQQLFAVARPTSILKRLIDPAEIASTVTYLCSPLSAATNGAAIHAEGGIVRSLL
ncbi:MAG: SDR family oxidoreductase [Rugosibacter sp.]|nr:SDR family oxidoreductase [Rugosibacter sp.]